MRTPWTERKRREAEQVAQALEWIRRKGVIRALLPYSGPRSIGWSSRPPLPRPRRPRPPLPIKMPRQRQPLPSEQRLVEGVRRAFHPHLRNP